MSAKYLTASAAKCSEVRLSAAKCNVVQQSAAFFKDGCNQEYRRLSVT